MSDFLLYLPFFLDTLLVVVGIIAAYVVARREGHRVSIEGKNEIIQTLQTQMGLLKEQVEHLTQENANLKAYIDDLKIEIESLKRRGRRKTVVEEEA